ncbi:MAG: TRAM domain-containing protein, partial [Planctomycetota bacterium]
DLEPSFHGARRDDVPEAVKKRRNNELLAIQADMGERHHRRQVGRRVEVLVEGPSVKGAKALADGETRQPQLMGRTRGDHIVVFDGPADLAGQYVEVEVTDAGSVTLFGRRVEAPQP